MDIMVAAILLAILLPILLCIGLWIRWKDGGDILFRQERMGRFGQPFLILKFRTMRPPKLGDLQVTSGETDARITATGRHLRSRRLDEFPQLLNVLKGDMSFVGPRPEVPKYVDLKKNDWQRVLSVRPGITGPAALAFRNEGDLLSQAEDADRFYRENILPQKLAIQLDYANHRTLRSDFSLLFRTLGVLRG